MTTYVNYSKLASVYTATSLPSDPSGWTLQSGLIAIRAQEPCGQVVGSAEIHVYGGIVQNPSITGGPATVAISTYTGTYIMIQMASAPIWYGYVQMQSTLPDGGGLAPYSSATPGGIMVLHCVGLAQILDQIYVHQGFVQGYLSGSPSQMIVIENPLFNALPTKNQNTLGERSATQAYLWNSVNGAYYFDLVTRSNPWMAVDVVNYLLNGYAQPQLPPTFAPVGPAWALSDPLQCLAYVPDKLDLEGKSILECINLLINPRRGMVWYATVAAGVITINVKSCAYTSITVGSYTIPATDTTATLDARGNSYITNLSIEQDISSQFDYIQVRGNHPLVGMSLFFNLAGTGSLVKGWDTASEGSWDPTLNQGPDYQFVWSRFLVSQTWNGANYNSTTVGLRNNIGVTGSGYDGTRGFAATDQNAPAQMLQLEKFIPLPFNQSYTTTPAAGALDMTSPLLGAMIFIYDSAGSGTYTDITDEYDVDIEANPPAVVIRGDMANFYSYLTSTATVIVTLGVREADPMVVSSQANTWINDVPRVLDRRLPNCEQWVALSGTVMGVNSSGTGFNTLSSSITTVDDNVKLYGWLAALAYWYGQPAVSVTWTDHSQIDTTYGTGYFQPGCVLTSVQRGDANITCNAVITGRAWDFTDEGWGTTYTTERILPDVDSVEGHPRVNFIFKSQDERQDMG